MKDFLRQNENFVFAVYLVASHYVFNLSYHCKARDVLLFIQEMLLGLPTQPATCSKTTKKGTNSASLHIQGIQKYYADLQDC